MIFQISERNRGIAAEFFATLRESAKMVVKKKRYTNYWLACVCIPSSLVPRAPFFSFLFFSSSFFLIIFILSLFTYPIIKPLSHLVRSLGSLVSSRSVRVSSIVDRSKELNLCSIPLLHPSSHPLNHWWDRLIGFLPLNLGRVRVSYWSLLGCHRSRGWDEDEDIERMSEGEDEWRDREDDKIKTHLPSICTYRENLEELT